MDKPILFTKRGCVPCSNLKRFLLTETELDFDEVDIESNPNVVQEYDIMTVPTLIVGDKRTTGFNPPEALELINELE